MRRGTRRALLRTVLAVAVFGLTARRARAEAPEPPMEKLTLAEADYQDSPKYGFSCGACSLFQPPTGCKVVIGQVSANGWCKLFDLVD
jgi:hypothetical protein